MLTPKRPFATARPAVGRNHSERPKLDIAHACPTAPHSGPRERKYFKATDCIESRVVMPICARYPAVTSTLTGKERKSVACKLLQTSRVPNHMETNARPRII